MARILFAWELGGGLGHLMQVLPLVDGVASRSHRLFAALKDLSRARRIFGPDRVRFLQAPTRTRLEPAPIRAPMNYAHLLHNVGYADFDELSAMVDAWRHLYEYVQPDLVVFDHSPTALLASRGHKFKRVTIGSGFCIPPDESPLPNLRHGVAFDPQRLLADEHTVLAQMNRVLADRHLPPFERVTQTFGEVDETLAVTFQELDHYPHRKNARYWGAWTKSEGLQPEWPRGQGQRIYAYLKPFPALPQLLGLLKEMGHPTIVLSDGIPVPLQKRFACETLRFETRHLDIAVVARQCELAILNAGHGTTASMLLAGRPVLELPIHLEQGLLANAVVRCGAGLSASVREFNQIAEGLQRMLKTDRYAIAAEQFATKYAEFDPLQHQQQITQRVEALITTPDAAHISHHQLTPVT